MKQATLNLQLNVKKTRKQVFLEQMEAAVPWNELIERIAPYYPEGRTGRPPFSLHTMLRVHFMQQWFTLSDPGMKEAFFDTPLYREFAQLDEYSRLPDESTILRFRHRPRESKKLDIIEALTVVPVAQIDHVAKTKMDTPEVKQSTKTSPGPAQQQQKQESEPVRAKTPVQTRGEQPVKKVVKETQPEPIQNNPAQPVSTQVRPIEVIKVPEAIQEPIQTPQERLRALVLAIDRHATFETADPENSAKQYNGSVAANLDDQTNPGFAQRTGRSAYTLHATKAPAEHNDTSLEIQYRNGQAKVTIKTPEKRNLR